MDSRQSDAVPRDAPERAFHGKEHRVDQDTGLRLSKRLTHGRHPREWQVTYADITSSDDEGRESGSQHGDMPFPSTVLADGVPTGDVTITPATQRDESGLPPTPPTLTSSDLAQPRPDTLAANPHFADAVRNALHSEQSRHRLSTPAPHVPPHTPDPSPPWTRQLMKDNPHPPEPYTRSLRMYPSSYADSYHTARETTSTPQLHQSQASSPAASRPNLTSEGYAENSTDMFFYPEALPIYGNMAGDDDQSGLAIPTSRLVKQISVQDHLSDCDISPAPRAHQLGASSSIDSSESPTVHRRSLRDAHYLNHTAYAAEDVDESDDPVHESPVGSAEDEAAHGGAPPDLGLSMPLSSTAHHVSAEDVNNLVYQHIQQFNVKRHSFVDSPLPMAVGIIAVHEDKHRPLKRAPRCLSLRENASEGSPRSSVGSSLPRPRHAQRSLQSSPVAEKEKLHRSSALAPQLGSRTTTITALTHDALVETRGDELGRPWTPMLERQSTLRRSHKVDQFEPASPPNMGTTGRRAVSDQDSLRLAPPFSGARRTLRHFSHESKLENNPRIRRTSLESFSSRRKDFDVRFSHPSQTPMSQFSDRTEAEVLEARGVPIFTHNNGSLLLVANGSRPSSKSASTPVSSVVLDEAILAAHPSTPLLFDVPAVLSQPPRIHVDSPLTNPRVAPEPPAFHVIPPTPNEELDRQLMADHDVYEDSIKPQRNPSLLQRARRYSENFVQPLFGRSNSCRSPQQNPQLYTDDENRPANLSPFWRPRYFWEDVDSDEEYDEQEYEVPVEGVLPRGGDTSNTAGPRRLFPRNMSVRMPGFRGGGGFLVGNSLGLDRHGTNNRRHHVARQHASQEVLRPVSKDRRLFTLPFTGGRRLQYVGTAYWRRRLTEMRQQKQDQDT